MRADCAAACVRSRDLRAAKDLRDTQPPHKRVGPASPGEGRPPKSAPGREPERLGVMVYQFVATLEQRRIVAVLLDHIAQLAEVVN